MFKGNVFDLSEVALYERLIRAAQNIDLWGEGDNPIGRSLLTSKN